MKYLFIGFLLLAKITLAQRDSLPELNAGMIAFVNQHIGKKVGTGECWDLAQIPLNQMEASWDGYYKFGKLLNPKKDPILPGDIIQFERVAVKYEDGNKIITESYAHHTAIVYECLGADSFRIAHQNTAYGGKTVVITPLKLSNVSKGKMTFYRPVR